MPQSVAVPYSFTAEVTSDFGQGIDLMSGEQRAVGAVIPSSRNQNRINSSTSHTSIVSKEDDYSSSYSAVVDVEGSTLTGSFSAGASVLEQSQMSARSFNLIIGNTVQGAIDTIHDPADVTLTKEAADYLTQHGGGNFINRYGTHFIGGFINGGEYVGTMNVYFDSVADQQSFSVSASAKISEGMASGSVNAKFSEALSSFSSRSSLQSYVAQSGDIEKIDSSDADSLIKAAGSFAASIKSDPTGGRRMVALGYPWSSIPQVQDILAKNGGSGALDINISQDVATILRNETAALTYLARTAAALAAGNTYAPVIATIAASYQNRINAAKQLITSLTLGQVSAMDVAHARGLCNSPTFKTGLDALGAGRVPVRWSYALDGAFNVPILNGNGIEAASFSGDPHWTLTAPHGDRGQVATVGYICNTSGNDGYIQAVFDWHNPLDNSENGRWYGPTVDLANPSGSVSTARWPKYNWNLSTATLV